MRTILSYWSFSISSFIVVMLLAAWIIFTGSIRSKGVLVFIFILSVLCFFSPLQILSAHYLFSAHMTVHVLLLLVIGPLLVINLNPKQNKFSSFFHFLKEHPVLSWIAGVSMMWMWHIPRIFNTAMMSMHESSFSFPSILESLSLIFAGIVFSAPIVHPDKRYRIDALSGVVYLFTACIGCSLLGLLITFAPANTYHHFLSIHDQYGLNKTILQSGITQSTDQQAAGLIMWVPCCLVYVSGVMYLLAQWFKQKEVVLSK